MKIINIKLTIITLLIPAALCAKTGTQLREDCAAFDDRNESVSASVSLMRMSECSGYIEGVLDLPTLYVTQGANYCIPDGTTRGNTIGAVRDYLKRPDVLKMNWPNSGAQVVINAVSAKWPCKETRK
jgi:Rap1a immunity proteins